MKGIRDLKARIRGVRNIQKITRAMEMVAATKLRRLQERAMATRPFADRIEALMKRVAAHADPEASQLLEARDKVDSEAVVVVGADKGLCGSYNSNLFRHSLAHLETLRESGVEPRLYLFGRRAQIFFRKIRGMHIEWVYPDAMERMQYPAVRRVLNLLVDAFIDDKVQRVRVIYTRMRSMSSFVPTTQELLPVVRDEEDGEKTTSTDVEYILEPSPDIIMRRLLPRYLEMQLYAAILESLASEFAARRIAMKSATDAADEMLDTLGMEYNKARQEGITSELLDIVGGVAAQSG